MTCHLLGKASGSPAQNESNSTFWTPHCSKTSLLPHTKDDDPQDTRDPEQDHGCIHIGLSSSHTSLCHHIPYQSLARLDSVSSHSWACKTFRYIHIGQSRSHMHLPRCTPTMRCSGCYLTQGTASTHNQVHGIWESTHTPYQWLAHPLSVSQCTLCRWYCILNLVSNRVRVRLRG